MSKLTPEEEVRRRAALVIAQRASAGTKATDEDFDAAERQAAANEKVVLEAEIDLGTDPRLAAVRGVDTVLIRQGAHTPSGSTLNGTGALSPAFSKPSRSAPAKSKTKDEPEHVSKVTLSGSTNAVKDILADIAKNRNVETLVVSEGRDERGSAVIYLSQGLSKAQIAALAKYGATYSGPTVEHTRAMVANAAPKAFE